MSNRAFLLAAVFCVAIVVLGAIVGDDTTQRAEAGPPVPALKPVVVAQASTCDDRRAVYQVEIELYHTLRVTQPGLDFEEPSIWRSVNLGDNDPLRGATRIGDCDFRVRSFITVGNETIRYTARATMRNGEWQVGELEMAQ